MRIRPIQYRNSDEKPLYFDERRDDFAPKALPSQRPRQLSLPLPPAGSLVSSSPSIEPVDSSPRLTKLKPLDRLKSSLKRFSSHRPSPAPQAKLQRHVVQQTFEQGQCLLLTKLPKEIRLKIWKLCIGGRHLHLFRGYNRLGCRRCLNEQTELPTMGGEGHAPCWEFGFKRPSQRRRPPPWGSPDTREHLLQLLRTCRAIYSEAIHVLYHDNHFHFHHIDTLIFLSRTILPSRLQVMRSVQLEWRIQFEPYTLHNGEIQPDDRVGPPFDLQTWEDVCEILKSMTCLQRLLLALQTAYKSWTPAHWRPMLEPLKRIVEPRVFEVELAPYRGQYPLDDLQDAYHFRIYYEEEKH